MENLKLSQELSIDTWKHIAKKVQQLNLENYSNEAFLKNLILLRNYLNEANICTDSLEKNPKYTSQIGAASLLQSIYNTKVGIHHKKAAFYENIYALDELGVKTITFNPIKTTSYNNYCILTQEKDSLSKTLTDGNFILNYFGYQSTMRDIKDFSFVLDIILDQKNNLISLYSAKAILTNFDAINHFPSEEEIVKFSYPDKVIYYTQKLNWNENPRVKQTFQTFDKNNSKFAKYLIKDKEHYYKK